MSEDFISITTGKDYEKIIHVNGCQTTVCINRFEIITKPTAEVHEEQALQQLRDWIRWHNAQVMSVSGSVSG